MKNYNLIKSFLTEPWAISELSTTLYAPLVAGLFNKNIEFSKEEAILPEMRAIGMAPGSSGMGRTVNISMITLKGALTKEDQECGPVGMATITEWIKASTADKSVDAIFLKLDTPGGTVVGTQETGDAIAEAVKVKPVLAFVDDLCCSGGYWLASQCSEIIANNNHAQVGSIGVMMTFQDVQPYYESLGVKFHSIRAPQSGDKNTIYDELRAGNYDRYKAEVLAPLADKFISIVKSARPGVLDTQTTGDVYFANKVVGSLVDSIMNFDAALQRCAELVTQNKDENHRQENANDNHPVVTAIEETEQKPTIQMNKPNINLVVGAEITANEAGNMELTSEQAEAIEQVLATSSTHAATISDRDATIVELQTKITALEKEPGAKPAVAVPDVDGADAEPISPRQAVTEFFESLK